MINTDNLKGRIKKYTNINDDVIRQTKGFDEQGRETDDLYYNNGVLSQHTTKHYTLNGYIEIQKNYDENGLYTDKIISFHDTDGDLILTESYDNFDQLIHSYENGVKQLVTNDAGQTLEVLIVRGDKTFMNDRFEYDSEGKQVKAQRFNEEGTLLLTMMSDYEGDLVIRRIYNKDGILFEINKGVFTHGRLTRGIRVSRGVLSYHFVEFFFDEWKDIDPIDYEFYDYNEDRKTNVLTKDQRQNFPEICALLDMLQYDVIGNKIDFIASMENFIFQVEYEYDVVGQQVSQSKDVYWPEFSTDQLTNESYWKKIYNTEGLLIEEEDCVTEKEWDTWNHYFYEYLFDEQGRIAQKRWKNLYYEKYGVVNYSYHASGGCMQQSMDNNGEVYLVTVIDHYGNCIYEKEIYTDGSGSNKEELVVEYYE
ncbi:hypothetical protein ACLI1A_15720 [Flavobacterium sp. RHBU_3]|uniref:hypothetical protein n=1 Tax=Flavobacterium sp. RHBU_3 TaxID=3391184 RepID=UPI003985061A